MLFLQQNIVNLRTIFSSGEIVIFVPDFALSYMFVIHACYKITLICYLM